MEDGAVSWSVIFELSRSTHRANMCKRYMASNEDGKKGENKNYGNKLIQYNVWKAARNRSEGMKNEREREMRDAIFMSKKMPLLWLFLLLSMHVNNAHKVCNLNNDSTQQRDRWIVKKYTKTKKNRMAKNGNSKAFVCQDGHLLIVVVSLVAIMCASLCGM